jgi:hypothetical protein
MAKYKAGVWQGNIEVAITEGNDPIAVEREITHYAMMYSQDGEVVVRRNRALARWINTLNRD